LKNLRAIYKPIQPTVEQTGKAVIYKEFLPNDLLLPYIYCYWELKTNEILTEPFIYRVVADGCIDIYFELDNPKERYVMGFCKQYTEFQLDNTFHYFGIRFLPAMFPQLFGIDANQLTDKYEKLEMVSPDISRFISNRLSPEISSDKIKSMLDDCFIEMIGKKTLTVDNRFFDSLNIILVNSGVINIDRDLRTGLSTRQMRRLFEYYVGDTPKIFSKVVRFQSILNVKPSLKSLRENKLFFDAGYYDQSHFIKEFKNFYGVPPSIAFGK
jgi:hypothetical protein